MLVSLRIAPLCVFALNEGASGFPSGVGVGLQGARNVHDFT